MYTFPDGRKYEGQFKDDEYHGKGTLVKPDGSKQSGLWKNGSYVGAE